MVDAFVGATAVILVLSLVSEPAAKEPGFRPAPDVVVRCLPGGRTVAVGDGGPIPADAALPAILADAPATLSLRLLVEATPDDMRCAELLRVRAEAANRERDAATAGDDRPILLVDVRPVAPEATQ